MKQTLNEYNLRTQKSRKTLDRFCGFFLVSFSGKQFSARASGRQRPASPPGTSVPGHFDKKYGVIEDNGRRLQTDYLSPVLRACKFGGICTRH